MIWYSSYNHSDVPESLLAIFSIFIERIIFSNTRLAHFKEKYFRRGTCWASYVSMTRKSSPKWRNSSLLNLFLSYSRWFLKTTQVGPACICLAEVQSLKTPHPLLCLHTANTSFWLLICISLSSPPFPSKWMKDF